MRRNCNLDLRLYSDADLSDDHRPVVEDPINGSIIQIKHHQEQLRPQQQQQQQLTLIYNGKVCVCDVTELQARYILMLASREMNKSPTGSTSSEPTSPTLLSPTTINPPAPGLSMTRSLQRFLQKRRSRIQATSPYNFTFRRGQ